MFLTRRDMLAASALGAGGCLLGPAVSRLRAEAAGSPPPKRFVFVLEGNGLTPSQVQPEGIDRKQGAKSRNSVERLEDVPLAGKRLAEAMRPIEKYKDRVTVIQGLSGRVAGGGHSNDFGALGCYSGKGGVARGETVDAALAKADPGIFPIINLGISNKPEHGMIYNVTAWDAGKKLPTQCKPDLAYAALFGSAAGGAARREFDAKRNLLDFMIDDVKRAEAALAAPEREKLQAYLGAFESMRARQGRLGAVEGALKRHAPRATDKFTSGVETDRLEAHFDIAAAALTAGLTNVMTIASGSGTPYFGVRFSGLGVEIGKHAIGHGRGAGGLSAYELSVKIRKFHFGQIARLMAKLDAAPEGDGSMLDNTLIVYLSDSAEGHHSRCWEWPFVLIGDLGGRLKTGCRYLCYPKYGHAGHRTVANLYASLLHAAGDKRDRFGVADPMLDGVDQGGPLAELG